MVKLLNNMDGLRDTTKPTSSTLLALAGNGLSAAGAQAFPRRSESALVESATRHRRPLPICAHITGTEKPPGSDRDASARSRQL